LCAKDKSYSVIINAIFQGGVSTQKKWVAHYSRATRERRSE
jgi:hypothetical protein